MNKKSLYAFGLFKINKIDLEAHSRLMLQIKHGLVKLNKIDESCN